MSKQVQAQKFTLSGSGVSSSATSISLVTLATPDGTAITMTDFGSDVGYATIEPGTAREESISFTGITSTTLTGVSRGLRFVSPFDVVAGNKKAHAGGTILVFSNTSAFYSRFVDDFNAQTIAGIKTFLSIPVLPASNPTTDNQAARKAYVDTKVSLTGNETIAGIKTFTSTDIAKYNSHPTFTDDTHIIDKKYADDLAIAGSPDASTTVKGIVEEATQSEIISGTGAGATGARLFVNPTQVAETGADKVIKTKSTGKIDASILPVKFGGTGADGALTISSGTTTVDLANAALVTKNYSSISITGTGQLAFSNPNTNGTIIVIKCSGNVTLTSSASPCINASGMGAAAGAASATSTPTNGTPGRTSAMTVTIGSNSGNTGGVAPVTLGITNIKTILMGAGAGGGGGANNTGGGNPGGPGGGGALTNNGVNGANVGGNTGGGTVGAGGAGGGALYIECAGSYTNTSAILSTAGANGSASTNGAASGAGGGGGSLYVYYNTLVSDTGTYTVAGGTGGSVGSGSAGGTGGAGYSSVGLNNDFS